MESSVKHYFVDEAGDPTLFNRRGQVLIGTPGNSSFFILGFIDLVDPQGLSQKMEDLRRHLLSDPYFQKVPSMHPDNQKTAQAFHAKDDIPEIRKEVYSLLMQHPIKFLAVIKDKRAFLNYVKQRNSLSENYRYKPDELYDLLVGRLFHNSLHSHESVNICFARRGASDRTQALKKALEKTRANFCAKWDIQTDSSINISIDAANRNSGLQAADYFMWALQRCFEKGEDRYLEYIWPKVGMIIDIDDTRKAGYGTYYNQKLRLSGDIIKNRPGI